MYSKTCVLGKDQPRDPKFVAIDGGFCSQVAKKMKPQKYVKDMSVHIILSTSI